jgi:hypothetical protein
LFEGIIYQLVYNLERHRLFNIRLRRWLILLCLVLPVTMWMQLWRSSYLIASLVTLVAMSVLALTWWAERRRYVRFVAAPGEQERTKRKADRTTSDPPLPAMSETRVCATGFFEVGGMRRYFVETPASYTSFETREHCVKAQVPLSRFLLLGQSNQGEVGWWYTFFQPVMIRSVQNGWLHFGLRPRPALRLEIARQNDSENEVLYLSFYDETPRSLVSADLQYDADPA